MAARQAVLGIEGGAFFYGSTKVFSNVSFLLDDARTALVGENGVGKSTLLKCLAGELELNAGKIIRSRNLKVGTLPQEVPPDLAPLSVRTVLERSLAKVGRTGEDWRIDILLAEIGAAPALADRPFGELSGGWQRLMLIAAAARLEDPDILILDEPTNHLDLENIATLEGWLTAEQRLPMLIVSHDRAFLDRVTNRTLFLRADGTHAFKAPFVQAREELLRRDAAAAVRHRVEAREIKRLEKVAARYHAWGAQNPDFHKRQKATETRIGHIEAARTQVYKARERRLELAGGEIEAKVALRVENLAVKTPDGGRTLFRIDRLAMAAGDRIALLGPNGAGKSSLLTALAAAFDPKRAPNERFYDGSAPIRFNPGCRVAFFDQTMADLPLADTPLDYLGELDGMTEKNAIRALAQAGFTFARLREPIAVLSSGERSRLMFLRMKLAAPNLYMLDEPTSHLDIEGQEALEAQLEETDVACLFVSHDRWFTRAAANRFVEIRQGRLIEVDDPEAFFEAQAG